MNKLVFGEFLLCKFSTRWAHVMDESISGEETWKSHRWVIKSSRNYRATTNLSGHKILTQFFHWLLMIPRRQSPFFLTFPLRFIKINIFFFLFSYAMSNFLPQIYLQLFSWRAGDDQGRKFYDKNTKLKIHFDASRFLLLLFFLVSFQRGKNGGRKIGSDTRNCFVKKPCIFTPRFMKFTWWGRELRMEYCLGGRKKET